MASSSPTCSDSSSYAADCAAYRIAGVGTLHLRRVTKTSISTTMYGAKLVLNTDQAGLKKGATLTVGYAKAGASAN